MNLLLIGLGCCAVGFVGTDVWLTTVQQRGLAALARARAHGTIALAATAAYVSILLLL